MSPLFMLDTNMASYIIRSADQHVRRNLVAVPASKVAISVLTEAELRFGVAKRGNPANLVLAVGEFLQRVDVRPWTTRAAEIYGPLRAALEQAGTPLGALDTLIAAHALAEDAVLVTHDHAFARIPDLRLADWTQPA